MQWSLIVRGGLAVGVALTLALGSAGTFAGNVAGSNLFGATNPENAAECKRLALKLDWLGRYQDRAVCT